MIEIKNVTKRLGGRIIVDSLSLTIKKGTVFGFLGPNGAGKTTTMKMLVGLNMPTEGSVSIGGLPPHVAESRMKIGFMPETPRLYDHLTGSEFLKFCGDLFRLRKPESSYRELLQRVGLGEACDHAIRTYSKGMKQRLCFAQAIVNDPEYLFLDEPLDGLDPIGRRALKSMIKTLNAGGATVFFNSHILFDTEELCHEIGVLHRGRLVYAGPVGQFAGSRTLEERFVSEIERLDEAAAPVS